MKRRIRLLLALLLLLQCGEGQGRDRRDSRPVKAEGEGVYYLEGDDNVEYARSMAIQMARARAIESVFGTAVSYSVHSDESLTSDGEERNRFSAVMRSLQRGIWVKDLSEPEVTGFVDGEAGFGFRARVRGLVRPLRSTPVETQGRMLVGSEEPHEAESLRVGEEFYFSFRAAADGYLAIYLADEEGQVCRAAPARGQGLIPVRAEQTVTVRDSYTKNVADISRPETTEVVNRIIYLFSPEEFALPLGSAVSYDRFHSWLQDMALADERFSVSWQTVRIRR